MTMRPAGTFVPSTYDTAVGCQPVVNTFPPSGSRRTGFSASAELLVETRYGYYLRQQGRFCDQCSSFICVYAKVNGKIVHGFGLNFQDRLAVSVSSFEI